MVQPVAQGPGALLHHAAQADVLVALVEIALQPIIMVPDVMHRQYVQTVRLQQAFQFLLIGVGVLGMPIASRLATTSMMS